jgi:hypothetical protein
VAKYVIPKVDEVEVFALFAAHYKWVKETHLTSPYTGDKQMLYYCVGSCPLSVNPKDLQSAPHPDNKVIIVLIECYQTEAGLDQHWADASFGAAHIFEGMDGLLEKVAFFQPLTVKGTINWF